MNVPMDRSSSLLLPLLAAVTLMGCAEQRLARADRAYERMAYVQAAERYERCLAKHLDRTAAIHAADAYRRTNRTERAAHWYAVADSIAPLAADQRYEQATVLLSLGRPEAAEKALLQVVQEKPELTAAVDLYASCQGYASFFKDTTHFTVALLPIPGARGLFSALPYREGLLVATERDPKLGRSNPWTEGSYLDLCYTEKRTLANWSEPEPIPGAVNGPYHEGPAALSADGRTLYFTRSNYHKVKLMKDEGSVSHLKLFRATMQDDGTWGDIREFTYNGEDFSVGHPALSADGRTLYFASDRPGSLGGSDIWRCQDLGNGWSQPENLGPTINTQANELFPTIQGDNLYFSSAAHENMGGLDILVSRSGPKGWTEPENLGYPINSTRDDMGLTLDTTGQSGFLSSDRNGEDRVYYFYMNEPIIFVEGFVTEDSTGLYLPNIEATLIDLMTGEDTTVMTGPDGSYRFKLRPDGQYRLRIAGADLITQSRDISSAGIVRNKTMREDFAMDRVAVGDHFALANIYYDYDKYDLRPESTIELDKIVRLMKDNPAITFELSSHTDSRGSDLYNLVLSDARANSAVNYLIQQGVDPERIVAKGYGEEKLVNGCRNGVYCSEEDHQANRRTEFKVLNIGTMAGR